MRYDPHELGYFYSLTIYNNYTLFLIYTYLNMQLAKFRLKEAATL